MPCHGAQLFRAWDENKDGKITVRQLPTAAAHAHRVALRPFVKATVDPIRAVAGSPEPSTARSHISQSSVASSVSGFSVASSRRLTRKQQDMFSPVQALPRVSRRW